MEVINKLVEQVAVKYGIFGLMILTLAFLIYRLVNKIIEDKDKQIIELAKENREYRERFTTLIDKHFQDKE